MSFSVIMKLGLILKQEPEPEPDSMANKQYFYCIRLNRGNNTILKLRFQLLIPYLQVIVLI